MGDLTGTIVGRYRIEERIGRGGMGEVYRAHDEVLERDVALKRMQREWADNEERRRRILREARAASALRHRAIVFIHDVIESGGELLIVQEIVTGSPLSDRLDKPLEREVFFRVAEECAEGLAAAAAAGVVHCDLKPENIILTGDGLPRILDFGVARRSGTDTQGSTRTGAPFDLEGSPSFMAPEILHGFAPTIASDIFSLGVVFYQMLTARHPFLHETIAATITSVLNDTPLPVSHWNPEAPPELNGLLLHMLAKDPAERLSHPEALLRELRRMHEGRAEVMRETAVIPYRGPAFVLAVRPFDSLTVDEVVSSFSVGLTGALRARLSSLEDVQVIDWPAETRTRWLLEGTVQRSGDRIRIRYRMVETERGRTVGGGVVQGAPDEIFQLEDQVTGEVVGILAERCGRSAVTKSPARTTKDAIAYDFYLQGRGCLRRFEDEEYIEMAIVLFRQALERDPDFALARAGLGDAFWKRYQATHDTKWAREAERAALSAQVTEELVAEIPATMGTILAGQGRPEAAAMEFRRALEIDPKCHDAWRGLARAEEEQGNLEAAEETYRRAVDSRPDDWLAHKDLGVFLHRHRRYQDALQSFLRVVELTPDSAPGYSNLGGIYQELGRDEEAMRAYERSLTLKPNANAYSNLATLHRSKGRYQEAAALYSKAVELHGSKDCRLWGNLGGIYQLMPGKEEQMRRSLERAAALAQLELEINPNDPFLSALRAQYLAQLEEHEEARQLAERALALAPGAPQVLYHVVFVFAGICDYARAGAVLKTAIAAGWSLDDFRQDPALATFVADPQFERAAREAAS